MVSNPVVQETPVEIVPPDIEVSASEAAPAAAVTRTQTRAVPAETMQPSAIPATPVATTEAVPAPAIPEAVEGPVIAAPQPAEPSAPAAENGAVNSDLGLLAALLAALGVGALAIWGFVSIGRRRAAPVVERPVVNPVQVPVPVARDVPVAPPLSTRTEGFHAAAQAQPAFAAPVAHAGAAVALPRSLPASFEERDSLLRRMVAARPDRANPFRSPRARLHRARLILQSLGTDFADREPWIDLSQYPSNWPAAANRTAAAA